MSAAESIPATAAVAPQSTEQIFAQRYTTTEKLLLSQAVHKYGAAKWDAISLLLLDHPSIASRTPSEREELFSVKACEEGYVGLMTDIGINVPAEGGIKPHAKPHLRLAQTHYIARMAELRDSISTYEKRFTTLMSEVQMIKTGEMDGAITQELRMGLIKKFGKKLLDSWMPEKGEVEAAVGLGEVSKEERAKRDEKKGVEDEAGEPEKGSEEVEDAEKKDEEIEGSVNPDQEVQPVLGIEDQPEEVSTAQVEPELAAPGKKTKSGRPPRGRTTTAPPPEIEEEMEVDQPETKEEEEPTEGQEPKPAEGGRKRGNRKPPPTPLAESTEPELLTTTPGPSSRPIRKGRTPAISEDVEMTDSITPIIEIPAESPHLTRADSRRRTSKGDATPAPPATGASSRSHAKRVSSTPARTPIPEPEVEATASPVGSASDLSDAPAETKTKGKARSRKPAKRNSRGNKDIEEEGEAEEEVEEVGDQEEVGTSKKGGNKRKASAPVTGAPSGKKRGKKAVSPVPTIATLPEVESDEESNRKGGRGSMPAPLLSATRRGRPPRESPGLSTRTRGSSPAASRRAPSVSSTTSATTPAGGDSSKRRGRPPRTKAGEEGEEEGEKPTRASGRKKAGETEIEEIAPTPKTSRSHAKKPRPSELEVEDSSKSKRGSGRISAPKRFPNQNQNPNQNEEDEHSRSGISPSASASVSMSPKKERTPNPIPVTSRPSLGGGRGSSRISNQSPGTRDRKMTAKMLLGLLDQVSSHKNGSVFMNPVREVDAPDYYEIIKEPMDLKTIRTKIRDGQISNLDEFENDVHLVFANAMVYNEKGSQVHAMAADMLKDAEMHLAQHRSMQQDLGR